MKLKELKTKNSLELPDVADAYIASSLKNELVKAVKNGKNLTVSAKNVLRIDTLCCQLLLLASQEFADKKKAKLTISSPSEVMINSLDILGFDTILNVEG